MSLRTAEQLTRSPGLSPTFTAADVAGDSFANDGRTMFRWKNTSGAPITVTIPLVTTVDGQAITSKTISVPATTGDVQTDVFPADYNDTLGRVNVTYSAVTSLTVACYKISKLPGT